MIGIIGAMSEEVEALKTLMCVKKEEKKLDFTYYTGLIANRECVLVQGGIGKVNAAISATLLFEKYPIDYLINIGSAGGLDLKQNVGDVVISNAITYHDVDVTAFNYEYGQMAGQPQQFKPCTSLMNICQQVLTTMNQTVHIGLIVSGDTFVSKQSHVDTILYHFPEAICVEMEAAAIAQVSTVYNTPFIIIRSLSDIFNKGENKIQFDEYIQKASQASAKMCKRVIEQL